MTTLDKGRARAVADMTAGLILASVEIAAPPERVFRALASPEITEWWLAPGIFRTTEWSGELRVGGRWRAVGNVGGNERFELEGEFLEIDPPRKLVHTWHRAGTPGKPTVVTYLLEPLDGGTRITLRHAGFAPDGRFATTCHGWETSFECLAELLARR
jgi:uncharacterized protein YndB with AHSA1/START domain